MRKPSTTPCKREDCAGFAIGRGLCSKHWKQWRKANPTISVPQDSRKQALRIMPATTNEVEQRLEISHGHAKRILREMHKEGKCHIGGWREPRNIQGSNWAPIYHKGAGPDVPLDRAMASERSYARALVRNRANHAKRAKAERPAAPVQFAALLAPLMVQG